MGFAYSSDRKEVINYLVDKDVDFVVIPSTGWGQIYNYLIPAVQEYIDRFEQAYFLDNPPTYILKFDKVRGKIE